MKVNSEQYAVSGKQLVVNTTAYRPLITAYCSPLTAYYFLHLQEVSP